MIEKQGTWADLEIGAYLQDKNGVAWKVERVRDGHFGIVNRDKERHILPPRPASSPVTLLVPTEAEALTTMKATLGAAVLGVEAQGNWRMYAWPASPRPGDIQIAQTHLLLFHGTYAEKIGTWKRLTEMHLEMHADPVLDNPIRPHTHHEEI